MIIINRKTKEKIITRLSDFKEDIKRLHNDNIGLKETDIECDSFDEYTKVLENIVKNNLFNKEYDRVLPTTKNINKAINFTDVFDKEIGLLGIHLKMKK